MKFLSAERWNEEEMERRRSQAKESDDADDDGPSLCVAVIWKQKKAVLFFSIRVVAMSLLLQIALPTKWAPKYTI